MTWGLFGVIVLHYIVWHVVSEWLRDRRERRESKLWAEQLRKRLRRRDEFAAQRRRMEGLE